MSHRRVHNVTAVTGGTRLARAGFMKTDRGRLCYRMNLEQIRNAILETAYLGVLDAYLRCKRPSFLGGIRSGMQRLTGRSLARALSQEVEQFAMVQKTEYGFDLLDAMAKRVLKLIGVTPDLWILPEGMKMYLNYVRKENFQSPNAGAQGAIAPVGSRVAKTPTDVAVDVAYDCQVVETKSFELPNMSEPLNPMERPATIGEYYVMQNHLRGHGKPEDYRSSWRDTFLYNEDKDGFTRISLDTALRNCARFDQDGDPVSMSFGHVDAGGADLPPDMFYRKRRIPDAGGTTSWVACDRMGDMHRQYLRDGGLSDWSESVVAKVVRADDGIARALRDGVELCRRIDAVDATSGAQNTWMLWLWLTHVLPRVGAEWNEEHGMPYPPTIADVNAARAKIGASRVKDHPYWVRLCDGIEAISTFSGSTSIGVMPLMDKTTGEIKALPVGFANWPGLCVLANPRYKETFGETHQIAARFVTAFETLYNELSAHTFDSVFLDGHHAPPWMKARNGRSTLFSNTLLNVGSTGCRCGRRSRW